MGVDTDWARRLAEDPVLCLMPWVHLHVTQQGAIAPCCQAPSGSEPLGDVNRQSIAQAWNGEAMRRFRSNLLQGTADPRCERCRVREGSGVVSLRQVTNQDYRHHAARMAAPLDAVAPPVYFDIRFSNVCNFRCRICSHSSSSRWHEDAVALGAAPPGSEPVTRSVRDFPGFLAQLESLIDGLEEIYFAGGEPLVTDEHYALLDLLIARGRTDVLLKYNTNFSRLTHRDRDALALWARFPRVIVSASLDGSHRRGELQRKEQDWEETVALRRRLRERCPHVRFLVTPTVSAFNVLHLPAFHREWVEEGLSDVTDFWPSVLIQPEAYDARVLPEPLKREARSLWAAHLDFIEARPSERPELRARHRAAWAAVLDHLDSADHSGRLPEFVARVERLDALRGERTAEVFPELAALFADGRARA